MPCFHSSVKVLKLINATPSKLAQKVAVLAPPHRQSQFIAQNTPRPPEKWKADCLKSSAALGAQLIFKIKKTGINKGE
jgi:hypothetical protein